MCIPSWMHIVPTHEIESKVGYVVEDVFDYVSLQKRIRIRHTNSTFVLNISLQKRIRIRHMYSTHLLNVSLQKRIRIRHTYSTYVFDLCIKHIISIFFFWWARHSKDTANDPLVQTCLYWQTTRRPFSPPTQLSKRRQRQCRYRTSSK